MLPSQFLKIYQIFELFWSVHYQNLTKWPHNKLFYSENILVLLIFFSNPFLYTLRDYCWAYAFPGSLPSQMCTNLCYTIHYYHFSLFSSISLLRFHTVVKIQPPFCSTCYLYFLLSVYILHICGNEVSQLT